MELSPYVDTVRASVANAAALADEHTRQVAERLGSAIESSTRLALIQALSDAASAISAELAPSSVEVRMAGQDPEFTVSVPKTEAKPTMLIPQRPASAIEDVLIDADEEPVAGSPSVAPVGQGQGRRGRGGRRDIDQRLADSSCHGRAGRARWTAWMAASADATRPARATRSAHDRRAARPGRRIRPARPVLGGRAVRRATGQGS